MTTRTLTPPKPISFSTQIIRDWDEIAQSSVEGRTIHQRTGANRYSGG